MQTEQKFVLVMNQNDSFIIHAELWFAQMTKHIYIYMCMYVAEKMQQLN